MPKQHIQKRAFNYLSPLLWAFLILVSLPIYFCHLWAYGDSLFLESLMVDLLKDGGKWQSWSFTTAPAYIPDIPIYLLSYFTLDYITDRLFFLTLCQILLTAAGLLFVAKEAFGKLPDAPRALIFFMLSFPIFLVYHSEFEIFASKANFLVDSHLFALLSLGLLLRIIKYGKRLDMVLLVPSIVIGMLDGKLFLAWFPAPALATLGAFLPFLIFHKSPYAQRFTRTFILITAATLLAFAVEPFITYWDTLALVGRSAFGYQEAFLTTPIFFDYLGKLFTTYPIEFRGMAIFWLIGVLIMGAEGLRITYGFFAAATHRPHLPYTPAAKQLPRLFPWYVLLVFSFACIFANFAAVAVSGQFGGSPAVRFYQMPISLAFLAFPGLLTLYSGKEEAQTRLLLTILVGLLCLVIIVNFERLKSRHLDIAEVRNHQGLWEKQLAQCLDGNKEAYGLHYGLAGFWAARSTNLFSKKGLRVYNIHNSDYIDASHYMGNIDWYLGAPGLHYNKPYYNFIVASQHIRKDKIIENFGYPDATFECPQSEVLVYNTSLDSPFKTRAKKKVEQLKFEAGLSDTLKVAAIMREFSISLPKGKYNLTAHYKPTTTQRHLNTPWDITLSGTLIEVKGTITEAKDGSFDETVVLKAPFSFINKKTPVKFFPPRYYGATLEYIELRRL